MLFVTRFDKSRAATDLTRVLRRLSRTAGLHLTEPLDLRPHTAATLAMGFDLPARGVQVILTHASIVTTLQLYQHADLSGQIDALAKLERSLRSPTVISRQGLPSNGRYDPNGVQRLSGGSSQTRTGDTRLFSSILDRGTHPLTEVKLLALARYLTALLGGAAVLFCRQADTGTAGLP